MKQSLKLLAAFFLAFVVFISFLPAPVYAQSGSSNSGDVQSFEVCAPNSGYSFSKMNITAISDPCADFYFKDGYVSGIHGTLIASINKSNIDANSLAAALDQSNLKEQERIDASNAYVIVNPQDIGIVYITCMDTISNTYSFSISSMSMAELEKQATQAIVQGAAGTDNSGNSVNSGNGMDSFNLGGMDSFDLGGMDSFDLGGMDTIGSGGMDTIDLGGMDYFDMESYTELKSATIENKPIKFKIYPRVYSNGEILIPLEEIAQQTGLSVTYSKDELTATIAGPGNRAVLTAYSDVATVNGSNIKLGKAPKMDKDGIMIPVSFLAKYYSQHFAVNKDKAALAISKKPIIEWRYGGYKTTTPYKEYNIKYIDGVKTSVIQFTGKNHIFKNITLYNKKTGKKVTVQENKVASYGKDWSTTPPSKSSSNSSTIGSLNQFYNRMNLQRFFNSSSFNTYGGSVIRSLLPF